MLAVGSRANDFNTPGVAEYCQRIDTRSDAITFNDLLRVHLVKSLATGNALTVGIVGGGATGVELAAELIQIASVVERYGIANASSYLNVVLIEAGARLLGPFPEKVGNAARDKLEQLGVTVRTGTRVTAVGKTAFALEGGTTVPADLKVWAAGVKAPPLIDTLTDLERSLSGQLVVGPTLATAGDPRIYALGDCASAKLPGSDTPVPTTAQAASQHAKYLCRYLPG
ncbi:FAD-dependent oxidoreductase [Sphingomonas sp. Ant20]|uniref:NAD(P)/FAD-dependent oxidoreductase n=1 Tax=Sphingomonas sp. Ant20 TaxID=104605 RepID=UPI002742223D|nr:FAD-dependent oxidoreductase [Sphingomonas sp. Ant20]